jgi:parvulin-like peptidyl-prolyl isomerase
MLTLKKMGTILTIGQQQISQEDLFPLLIRYQMLTQLVQEVIVEQAIANIECTEEEKTLARQGFCQQKQIPTEEHLQQWAKSQHLSPEQLENLILKGLRLEKFKQETWGEQIENYFLKRKGQLDKVIYSLIRTQDVGIAQELYFRLQENESSFPDLAKQYSQGAEAETGGLLGPVEMSTPHPQISQMLAASQPGKVMAPARVGNWYIILRLEKMVQAQLDGAMLQRLFNELFQSWLQEQIEEKVKLEHKTEN